MTESLYDSVFLTEPDISALEESENHFENHSDNHPEVAVQPDVRQPPLKEGNEDPIVVVVAGLPRSGKSRALSDIFNASFTHEVSPSSVTLTSNSINTVISNRNVKVIDTPGLGAQDVSTAKAAKDLKQAIGTLDYVVLYCISVSPDRSLTVADEHAMKALQKTLGKDVWKRCVLLFTFCDFLQNMVSLEKYNQMLAGHIQEVNKLLNKVQASSNPFKRVVVPKVVHQDDVPEEQEEIYDIVAIPVLYDIPSKKKATSVYDMDNTWRMRAILEILRKLDTFQRIKLWNELIKTNALNKTATGAASAAVGSVAGAAFGAMVGGVIGVAAYGVGAIPGALIGAAVGGSIGGTWSMSMSQIVFHINAARNNRQIKAARNNRQKPIEENNASKVESDQEVDDKERSVPSEGHDEIADDAGKSSDIEQEIKTTTVADQGHTHEEQDFEN